LADDVSEFVKTEKLTEENLKKLDVKISEDTQKYKATKSVASTLKSQSVKSIKADSKKSFNRVKTPSIISDTASIASSRSVQSI